MKKTLQDQYLLIKEGKGHVGVFLTEAKRQFPNIVRNAATFDEAVASLKTKNIISENILSVIPAIMDRPKKESYETAFEAFLAEARKKKDEDEKVKAEEKKVSKPVEEDLAHNYDNSDDKNPDNMIFDQIMTGYYAEMKDPKNADKTMQELKDIVFKNLAKDPIYYTKDGQFGVKDLGYVTEAPGLGEPKEPKGKYKSSGYGDLNESQMYYTDEDEDEEEEEVKDVRDYSWTKGFTEEETKLREVIRKIISEELDEVMYQAPSVSTSNTGGGGRRYIPNEAFLSQELINKFNFSNPSTNAPARDKSLQIPHIKFLTKPEGSVMLISNFLYNAVQGLERGRTSREKEMGKNELEKLISDLDPMVRALIKKNVDPKMSFGNYHVVDMPIEREKGVGVKIPLSKEEKEKLEEIILRESLLKESVEKELADINKEAEHEVLQAKLDKIDTLIDHKRSKLSKLDEDEDMKALTDKKKVKELEKDIKKLEVARKKVEKIISKFKGKKPKSKEVIDETEDEFDLNPEYKEDADQRQDDGQSIDSIVNTYSNMPSDESDDLEDYLEDREDNY